MAKMGEDVGKDDIEFNMDLLLNKACYLDALEVFIKSSDFIFFFPFGLSIASVFTSLCFIDFALWNWNQMLFYIFSPFINITEIS